MIQYKCSQEYKRDFYKGFTMDDEELKENGGGNYWKELLARIKDIKSSEQENIMEEEKRFCDILGLDVKDIFENNSYWGYLTPDIIRNFNASRKDIIFVLSQYKLDIIHMISNNQFLQDEILKEAPKRRIRHDKSLKQTIDFSKVLDSIFSEGKSLNDFEKRAKVVILTEIVKLINFYGMRKLKEVKEKIVEEIRLGIFEAKTNKHLSEEDKIKNKNRKRISDVFGIETIPYIENYELLKKRIFILKDFSQDKKEIEELGKIIKTLDKIDKMMLKRKDGKILNFLKQAYDSYERINRKMILNRLYKGISDNIDKDKGDLLLLHFIPEFDDERDFMQKEHQQEVLISSIQEEIEKKYGRKYDSRLDIEEVIEKYQSYEESKKNPYDFKSRIPLKNSYTNESLYKVITVPTTNLSCLLTQIGYVKSHLNRMIAIGLEKIPIGAIKTINSDYNDELDIFSFEQNSVPLPEIIEQIEKGKICEILIDWTQVKASYILIIKNSKTLPKALLEKVQKYHTESGLPVRIYDVERRNISECSTESLQNLIPGKPVKQNKLEYIKGYKIDEKKAMDNAKKKAKITHELELSH